MRRGGETYPCGQCKLCGNISDSTAPARARAGERRSPPLRYRVRSSNPSFHLSRPPASSLVLQRPRTPIPALPLSRYRRNSSATPFHTHIDIHTYIWMYVISMYINVVVHVIYASTCEYTWTYTHVYVNICYIYICINVVIYAMHIYIYIYDVYIIYISIHANTCYRYIYRCMECGVARIRTCAGWTRGAGAMRNLSLLHSYDFRHVCDWVWLALSFPLYPTHLYIPRHTGHGAFMPAASITLIVPHRCTLVPSSVLVVPPKAVRLYEIRRMRNRYSEMGVGWNPTRSFFFFPVTNYFFGLFHWMGGASRLIHVG